MQVDMILLVDATTLIPVLIFDSSIGIYLGVDVSWKFDKEDLKDKNGFLQFRRLRKYVNEFRIECSQRWVHT